MSKIRYLITNFQKSSSALRLCAHSVPLTYDFGDLKLRDLPKLWYFKRIMPKLNFQKSTFDVISVTLSLLRHQKCHQINVTIFFYFGPLPIKISGYANGWGVGPTIHLPPIVWIRYFISLF